MHVISSIYFHFILRYVIYMFLFVVLQVQLKYVSPYTLRCNTAYLIYVCQTAAFLIGKSIPSWATTDDKSTFPYWEVSSRSNKPLSDLCFYIVNTIRPKWCSKSYVAFL